VRKNIIRLLKSIAEVIVDIGTPSQRETNNAASLLAKRT
jgi:hypothetical protein